MMKEIIYRLKEDKIVLSVMIPMFRARFIGWVSLESLIRQRGDIPPWELVIAEEQGDETMGLKNIYPFLERGLRKCGCVKLKYISLKRWIPLADKFRLMIRRSDRKSLAYVFQAADYYSNPKRLSETYKAFQNPDTMWLIPSKLFVFNIKMPDHILLVDKSKTPRRDDTPGKAVRGKLIRQAAYHLKKRDHSIDGLIHKVCQSLLGGPVLFTINKSNSWKHNLAVDGIGTISSKVIVKTFRRPERWSNQFSAFPGTLSQIVPDTIARRLIISRKYVSKHNAMRGALG